MSVPLCQAQGGPHVVALGGGHGLAITLSAVSRYAGRVTAIVSAADDGGSSGRLRADWPGPAPGDVRRCLLELAGTGPLEQAWAKALDFRFPDGDLAGHSLGNLVLVGLSETMGDFVAATAEVGRLLGVTATVLPAASVGVNLCAEIEGVDGPTELVGQVNVAHTPAPDQAGLAGPGSPGGPSPGAGGDSECRPGGARARLAVHQRAGRLRRPGHPGGAQRAASRARLCLQPRDPGLRDEGFRRRRSPLPRWSRTKSGSTRWSVTHQAKSELPRAGRRGRQALSLTGQARQS